MNNLAIIDLETSGTNPSKHSILEIGIIPLQDEKESFHVYIKPTKKIHWSKYAKVNFEKYSENWEKHAVPPKTAIELLTKYLNRNFGDSKVTLIGHNIAFDLSFLKKLAYDAKLDEIPQISHRAIDTYTLLYILQSQDKIPELALNSDGAFKYFNIEPNEKDRHTALGDAIATKELFKRVTKLLNEKRNNENNN